MAPEHSQLLLWRPPHCKPILFFIREIIQEKVHLREIVFHLILLAILGGKCLLAHHLFFGFSLLLLELFELLGVGEPLVNGDGVIVASTYKGLLISREVGHLCLCCHIFILLDLFSVVHLSQFVLERSGSLLVVLVIWHEPWVFQIGLFINVGNIVIDSGLGCLKVLFGLLARNILEHLFALDVLSAVVEVEDIETDVIEGRSRWHILLIEQAIQTIKRLDRLRCRLLYSTELLKHIRHRILLQLLIRLLKAKVKMQMFRLPSRI